MKKNVNYLIDEDLKENFKMTVMIMKKTETSMIEEMMRDYIIKNKSTVNDYLLQKLNNKDNE